MDIVWMFWCSMCFIIILVKERNFVFSLSLWEVNARFKFFVDVCRNIKGSYCKIILKTAVATRKSHFFTLIKRSRFMSSDSVCCFFQCSVSCGKGLKQRPVVCVDEAGKHVTDYQCKVQKPKMTTWCRRGRCPFWWSSPWSQVQ